MRVQAGKPIIAAVLQHERQCRPIDLAVDAQLHLTDHQFNQSSRYCRFKVAVRGVSGRIGKCHRQQLEAVARSITKLPFLEQFAPGEDLVGIDVMFAGDERDGCARRQ
jgi:hypothetical protein